MDRRDFLRTATVSAASAALAGPSLARSTQAVRGQAEHCIFIWLGGGMGQIDTFDPKGRGQNKGTPKVAGSVYDSIPTCVPGVRLCEHLKKTAALMDRVTAIRTINHHVIDEHAFATNLVHTGRMLSGTVTYPSIGSIVSAQRGPVNPDVPTYMLIGYPNVSRGPGFLGAKYGYVYLTDTESGPAGFTRPRFVNEERAATREKLLKTLRSPGSGTMADYAEAQAEAMRLSGPRFMQHFDLSREPADLRLAYGGEFGQRCLLARRLVQAGVRFIEVSHNLNFINGTGWDVHNEGIDNQHTLIQELDTAFAALILDLEAHKLLDRTLIAIGTEFGRPAEFDAKGGRGHQGSCFTLVLAGGGLRHRGAYGVTDDLSKKIIQDPVSIPDFLATIIAALGGDPAKELFDGSRPVPSTDDGHPITALFG